MIIKSIVLSVTIGLLAACTQSQQHRIQTLTYEEKIDALNAEATHKYQACLKTLKPNEDGSILFSHGDGLCSYTDERRDINGKTCKTKRLRKHKFASRAKQSCEPYHLVQNSNGALLIEAHLVGHRAVISTTSAEGITEDHKWLGDLFCGNSQKSESFFNASFEPYLFSKPKRRTRKPNWDNFGWNAIFEDGSSADLKNLKNFRGYKNCLIFWRYPEISTRYETIQRKLGY